MSDIRINKFIFGDIFLRLKTTAKNIKVKKTDAGYNMELLTLVPKRMLTQVPVEFLKSFKGEDSIHNDAIDIGYEKDKSGTASTAPIGSIEEKWGDRFSLRTLDKHATYYYLNPKDQNYAVKIGPLFKSIDEKELVIDWENLQWGTKEQP